jgi:hypothetical protein
VALEEVVLPLAQAANAVGVGALLLAALVFLDVLRPRRWTRLAGYVVVWFAMMQGAAAMLLPALTLLWGAVVLGAVGLYVATRPVPAPPHWDERSIVLEESKNRRRH